jgi:hypothetical protein
MLTKVYNEEQIIGVLIRWQEDNATYHATSKSFIGDASS